jgi:hypothetical protein
MTRVTGFFLPLFVSVFFSDCALDSRDSHSKALQDQRTAAPSLSWDGDSLYFHHAEIHRESSGDGHPMSLPFLGRRERDLPTSQAHTTTLPPFCSTTAITLLGLCDSFTMLSLQGDSAVEFENKVVAVMSSRSFSEGSNIKTDVHSVCYFVMTL